MYPKVLSSLMLSCNKRFIYTIEIIVIKGTMAQYKRGEILLMNHYISSGSFLQEEIINLG
jgi:hypothetical protein